MHFGRFGLVLLLTLAACATPGIEDQRIENPAVPMLAELPPPSPGQSALGTRQYYLGPRDALSIEIFGIDELSRSVEIDGAGMIDYPLIGTIKAAGMTREELAGAIENRLRGGYVRDPHVIVNLTSAEGQTYLVSGAVNAQGDYIAIGEMTLTRAVTLAGGVSENANNNIAVFRQVDGQEVVGLYNLSGIMVGNYPDPSIYAGDRILVVGEESKLSQLFEKFSNVLPLILLADRLVN